VPTEPSISRDRVFRFGPFDLSERQGELRKSGVRIKLQEQPFRVLVELVGNSGDLVSREDLHKKLWPADTFVDFDVGLNSAIRKLRQALNDDADHPHYIETLAKRGYRFLAPITEMGAKGAEQNPQPTSDVATASDTSLLTSSASASPVHAGGSSTRRRVWIAAGTVVAAIVATLAFWLNRPAGVPIVEAVTQLTDDGEPKPYTSKIVTDGLRVYFNEGSYGSLRIAQVAVTGGSVAVIPTTVVAPRLLGLAPEGSALLAKSGAFSSVPNPLWQIPLPTGEPRRIGTIDVQDASFFPDGRILFARRGDLYVAEKDGSNPHKIVSVEGVIRQPSISPDGQRLLFTVWSGLPMSIVESMADGSGPQPIVNTSDSGRVCCAQWSPDGRYILFQNRHEGRRDLWFLSMRPGFLQRVHQPIQLTNGPLSYTFPVMSPDGKQIFALGIKERGELVRFDVRANQFLPFLSGISAFNPTFSRDGNWVAYTSYPDHTLWRSRSDGSERLQLTYPPMQVYVPFISPDGKRVVYGNDKGEIYVISMDGGPPQRIVDRGENAGAANWSPDGNLLVFTSARDAAHYELQFLDLQTGKRSVVPDSRDLDGGQWVAENTLVATSENGMKFEIFDVRTQQWSDLVPGKVPGSVVNWAHSLDYQYVYYTTGGAEPKAMRIRLADHNVETIASLKELRRAVGPDGNTQISVAPDGSAIFTRDVGTQEIYALTLKWP